MTLLLLFGSSGGGSVTTQYVQMQTITGQTGLVMTLFTETGDTVLYTSDSVTEKTNAKTKYTATFGESVVIPSGTYFALLSTSSGVPITSGYRVFAGTDGETATEVPLVTSTGNDQLTAIEVDAGVISGFPDTLTIGDSYTADTGQIKVLIQDSNGDPLTAFGSLDIIDADISFKAFRPNDSLIIVGTCQYVDNTPTESYVLITLHSSETLKGKAEFTYEGRLKFVWLGASASDTDDDVQKTYKTTPFKFLANP